MAYTDIDKPSDFFETTLYTGNGGTNSISSLDFQPDWLWIKCRSDANGSNIFDALRGTNSIHSDTTGGEADRASDGFTSLDNDGFTLNGSGSGGSINVNSRTYAAFNWKAGTTSGISGSANITPNAYSFNQTSGFSVVTYNGTDVNGNTVLHGLGAVPHVIFVKRRVGNGYDWVVYHKDDVGGLYLNSTAVNNDSSSTNIWFNGNTPTSTQFHIGTDGRLGDNVSTGAFVAYCFAPKQGYSKFGSYLGTEANNADAPFVWTGFKPAWFMVKNTAQASAWEIYDNKRLGYNSYQYQLRANEAAAEGSTGDYIDFLSNGFKIRHNSGGINETGDTFIYMAFAENPFVTSTGIPATAR
jgi:hypothetical protein